jgi:hypothetical protein
MSLRVPTPVRWRYEPLPWQRPAVVSYILRDVKRRTRARTGAEKQRSPVVRSTASQTDPCAVVDPVLQDLQFEQELARLTQVMSTANASPEPGSSSFEDVVGELFDNPPVVVIEPNNHYVTEDDDFEVIS